MTVKKLFSKIFILIIFVLFTNLLYSQTYYIHPSGIDAGEGNINSPFKTIEYALKYVSEQDVHTNTINIYIRQGVYHIAQSIQLNSNRSHINIQAYQDEEVIFSGGIPIPVSSIERISFSQTAYLPKREVLKIDLKKLGITDYGDIRNVGFARPYGASWGELFINKKEMHLSRWPNTKRIPMGKVLDHGSIPRNDDFSNRGGVIKYDSMRINKWAEENDVWISGYFKWGYADDMVKLSHIDTVNNTFTTATPTLYGFDDSEAWRKWYGVNILTELDHDREYYIDRQEGLLYFIFDKEDIQTLEFSLLKTPFFTIEGSQNISISGIIFEAARGHGISMNNTENVIINACEFRNLGGLGVLIGKGIEPFENQRHEGNGISKANVLGSLQQHLYANTTFNREGGVNNKIIGCIFHQLGAGGVSVGGGNRKTLEPGNNTIDNCVFYDVNRIEKSYRPAVSLTGVGQKVTHCEIYNTPSMAVLMHGNDHLLEYNYIHDVCLEVEDQGAIYYGRDPSERGMVIRYNYFENIPDEFSTSAVYSDDGACGITVESNVFYKAGKMNVLLGGGSDNRYINNIFMDNQIGIHVDNRLQNWSKAVLDKDGIFEQRLVAVDFKNPPYSTAYPALVTYYDQPDLPKNNVVEANVFWHVKKTIRGNIAWLNYKENKLETDKDLSFSDADFKNITLYKKSIIFSEIPEFQKIPFHKIGLY